MAVRFKTQAKFVLNMNLNETKTTSLCQQITVQINELGHWVIHLNDSFKGLINLVVESFIKLISSKGGFIQ